MTSPRGTPAAARTVLQACSPRLRHGSLTVQLPDGSMQRFGNGAMPHATLSPAQLERVCSGAQIGRHWLCRVLHRGGLEYAQPGRPAAGAAQEPRRGGRRRFTARWVGALFYRDQTPAEPQHQEPTARKTSTPHYDLGNAFYRLWLDDDHELLQRAVPAVTWTNPWREAQHAKVRPRA